ncbi:MAG: FMN-binding protein [Solobacterium sp.]|jgi:Na+-translocating ferredoxin:NAD+ oxidoreductase RnfG subunit|nr:FMN-binding protein [Solobacterium sp.]MCH4222022.1 FMN-binding protein [Solobacterium sp.]
MKKDSILYKVVLLGILCSICGVLMSAVNSVTAPVIAEAAIAKEKDNLEKIYPGATFTEVTGYDDPTGLVTGVYDAEGEGTVYKIHAVGYNSSGFDFMVAFNTDGSVGGYVVISESETSGFGKRCFEDDYTNQIMGITSKDDAPLLSGATLTSTAVKNGISAAEALFNASNN